MRELSCGIVQVSGKSELPQGKWKFYYCTMCRLVSWTQKECCGEVVCISGECK